VDFRVTIPSDRAPGNQHVPEWIDCRVRRVTFTMTKLFLPALLMFLGSTAWCLTEKQPKIPDVHPCQYSNQVFDSDVALMRQKAPTRFRLMTSRYVEILQAARGKHCTGTATVAFDGHNFVQTGMSDDPGLEELIPSISSLTGMSLVDTFDLTTFAIIAMGILVGYAGFWRVYPNRRARWIGAAVFICLGLAEAEIADVYFYQTSPLIAGIPWVLYFAVSRKSFGFYLSATLLAFSCSWCSMVRIGTSLICMAFLVTLLIGRCSIKKMFVPLLLIILACIPSVLVERRLITRRDAVLASLGESPITVNRHPIWHSIYIGLGFIPNSQVPEYRDSVGIDKVRSIDASAPYTSAKYELILRREVLNIAKHSPMLLVENLAAKAGIVILLAVVLLFPVRRVLFAETEALWLDSAFTLAIVVSAMNAILVMPKPAYLLTFLCLTFLYSSVKLCSGRFLSSWAKTPLARE
jgi:hypothetical protein